MTMQEFIDAHRGELDELIRGQIGDPNSDLDDNAREDWVLNSAGMYNWACSEGVDV